MPTKPKVIIVLPAYNEGQVIGNVVRNIRKEGFRDVVVVNDCSTDLTASIASKNGAKVFSHPINRGTGATTQTGISAALLLNADIVVLMDSDGQHLARDIKKVIQPILNKKAEVVIGSRLLNRQKSMPLIRRMLNQGGNFVTWFFFGLWVTDSQSGFKAFSRDAAKQIKITSNGFEFCSEIIREIHDKRLKFVEVPIHVIYSEYSMSKGQSLSKSVPMLFKLILRSFMR